STAVRPAWCCACACPPRRRPACAGVMGATETRRRARGGEDGGRDRYLTVLGRGAHGSSRAAGGPPPRPAGRRPLRRPHRGVPRPPRRAAAPCRPAPGRAVRTARPPRTSPPPPPPPP